jgi:hypothetical protein
MSETKDVPPPSENTIEPPSKLDLLKEENEALRMALQRQRRPSYASVAVSEYRPKGRVSEEVDRHRGAIHKTVTSHPGNADIVTFREVCDILNQNYNYEESIKSTTLDIISVYLRGQKILYIEAKTYCEQQLYALMLPTIAITAL